MRDSDRNSKVLNVVRVSSGNFLEMFDFMVFGYYASAIGHTFFPSGSAFSSLMLALMTFAHLPKRMSFWPEGGIQASGRFCARLAKIGRLS
jgi:hypothetical protein